MDRTGARVMVLGGGGREHALARSPSVATVLVAPGNPGCVAAATVTTAPINN